MSVTNVDDMAVPSARRISWLEIFCYAAAGWGGLYVLPCHPLHDEIFHRCVAHCAGTDGHDLRLVALLGCDIRPAGWLFIGQNQNPMGRRRPWLLGAVLPAVLFFWMLSAPSEGLSAGMLALWMGVAIIGFFSAQTMFIVPHMSLGAELTDDYHERTKIFAARHAGWIAGYISALGTMYFLILAEGKAKPRCARSMPTNRFSPVCLPPAACWFVYGACASGPNLPIKRLKSLGKRPKIFGKQPCAAAVDSHFH